MTIHQPIMIDPASIVAVGEMRARRSGRPKKGVVVEDAVKRRAYNLTDAAHAAVVEAARTLGVSESAVVEALAGALAGALTGRFSSQ